MAASLYRSFVGFDWLELQEKAKQSPRLRAHFNLHQSYEEPVQKTLIYILKSSYIPPHFHRHAHQKELFLVLAGQVKVLFFEQDGSVKDIAVLGLGEMIEIFPCSIHTVVCLSESAKILEVKRGPFIASDCKEFLDWTVLETSSEAHSYCKWLETAEIGQTYE